jgi:hypothetical protein
MLSSKKEEVNQIKQRLPYFYRNDEYIDSFDIDVHYFDYPKKKTGKKQVQIQKLEILSSGFEIPSVNITIEEQNTIAEELFYALKS